MSAQPVNGQTMSLVVKIATRYGVDSGKLLSTLKATAFRQRDNIEITNEQMMALLIVADQYKLNPFTKEIYAFFDKKSGAIVPVVSVDGWTRIINEHEQLDGVEFRYSEAAGPDHKGHPTYEWIECSITRKDRSKPIPIREFFDEVVRKVDFATPWDTHPKRMHRHKALIQCARLAFGFAGIYDQDEAERIIEHDVTPEPQPISVSRTESIKERLKAKAAENNSEASQHTDAEKAEIIASEQQEAGR